jgi:hypothetical protein
MSASDPDVCNVYNDPRFRKAAGPAPPPATGITGRRDVVAASELRRIVEALAERYESTREEMGGSTGWTPRCPLCGVTVPAHESTCDFGRFLGERRAAATPEKPPPDAEAVVLEMSRQVDGVFDAYNRTQRPGAGSRSPSDAYRAAYDAAVLQPGGSPWKAWLSLAVERDAAVARLVEALGRARIACHPACRRNSHLTSDCPSTHFIKRPCACECDCPAGPHNAAVDAAIAMVPKAPKAPA